MMHTIDHAELALTLRNNIRPDEMADPDTANWLAMAQVHATLALAAQQRLANEIEFVKFAVSENSTITDQDGLQKLADRVVEGLGI